MRVINFFTLLFFLGLNTISVAQTTELDSLLDDFIIEEEGIIAGKSKGVDFHFLYLRSNFDNATYYAGREIGNNQINLSQQVHYFNSHGFSFGVSGAWYSKTEPGYSTTVLTAGYGNSLKFLDGLRYTTSYNYYLYNKGDNDYSPVYHSNVNLGLSFRKKWIGTRINTSIYLGQEIGASLNYSLYTRIKLFKINKYDKIQLEPEISMYFSEESVLYESISYLDSDQENPVYNYAFEDKFGLMNTQMRLPLTVSYKDFDFELAYIYNLPRSIDKSYSYKNSSNFNFSVGYVFSIIR